MTTVGAVRIHATGGPENLRFEEVELAAPAAGEALVRHHAIGVNFIDTYHRSGLYPLPLPAVLGTEAAGVVEAVGAGVGEVAVGQRVAYAGTITGAYAGARRIPAARLVPLPDDVPFELAAAMMLKGMTAEYLLRRTHRVTAGETIVFHAAAGGVGLIACQWARALGARVIGVVGSAAKAELARAHGCAEVVVLPGQDLAGRVRELTGGRGVPVVYDSVGRDTFEASLDCLAPRGLMVSFGNASGPVPPVSPLALASRGSLYLTRPTLAAYTADREELLASAAALFAVVRSGSVRVNVSRRYPLAEAGQAHRDLEGRRTTGSVVLLP
jgi:NADPH2:quinone reductase